MDKKVLLLVNGYQITSGCENQISRLTQEFAIRGVKVDVKKSTDLLVYFDGLNIQKIIEEYRFCVCLDKDRYIAKMLEKSGLKLYNSQASIEKCDDKMLTHIFLANNGIRMPTTISSMLCYHDNGNRNYLKKVEDIIGFPMIVKENYGSLGKQVYLINSHDELFEIENKLIHIPHLFQKFISSSRGKDYRIIIVGGKVIAYMKRENKNSYLSNLATGGKAYNVDLPNSFLETAVKVAKILELDYCGVDLLEGENGEPILSEVNSNAFFEGIEKVTGKNVAGAYVEYLLKE